MIRKSPRLKYHIRVDSYSRGLALIVLCRFMSIGCVQTSTMDMVQMFPESFPVLKGLWVLVATIKPNPGAEEPYENWKSFWKHLCSVHSAGLDTSYRCEPVEGN